MQECFIGSQPADSPKVRALWRRACDLLRKLMTGISDPYRPERHYMRGPGPKCRQGSQDMRDGLKYCPRCAAVLVLQRIAPKLGPLPELRIYKCLQCGCVVEEDIDR
jgi:hypothetical protein